MERVAAVLGVSRPFGSPAGIDPKELDRAVSAYWRNRPKPARAADKEKTT